MKISEDLTPLGPWLLKNNLIECESILRALGIDDVATLKLFTADALSSHGVKVGHARKIEMMLSADDHQGDNPLSDFSESIPNILAYSLVEYELEKHPVARLYCCDFYETLMRLIVICQIGSLMEKGKLSKAQRREIRNKFEIPTFGSTVKLAAFLSADAQAFSADWLDAANVGEIVSLILGETTHSTPETSILELRNLLAHSQVSISDADLLVKTWDALFVESVTKMLWLKDINLLYLHQGQVKKIPKGAETSQFLSIVRFNLLSQVSKMRSG